LLKQLGYKYLVVDSNHLTSYARREQTPKEKLDLLSLREYALIDLNVRSLNVEINEIEVPTD